MVCEDDSARKGRRIKSQKIGARSVTKNASKKG